MSEVERRDVLILPPVIEDDLAAASLERPQVRIDRVEVRRPVLIIGVDFVERRRPLHVEPVPIVP